MKTVLITGSQGFIGKNLKEHLKLRSDLNITYFDKDNSIEELTRLVESADFIYHIAGVNRPKDELDFSTYNTGLTEDIIKILDYNNKKTPLLITSSIQAGLDNAYGQSKLAAENLVKEWHKKSDAPIYIYRLPGVFGKWSKPNYNSVVATFCHNIANNLPITISDPDHTVVLAYIDDVIEDFIKWIDSPIRDSYSEILNISRTFETTLKDLSHRIFHIRDIRKSLIVPNLSDTFNKFLYATYISFIPVDELSYSLERNSDDRGWLTEFIKSSSFGQVFISKTKPGISRGDHWHHTKIEKFFVISGQAEISFRSKIDNNNKIVRYKVSGDTPTVLDIPVGHVHSIRNIGDDDLITVFWANEIHNKDNPDTYYEKVSQED